MDGGLGASLTRPRVLRLYHKKSRTGCQGCRARRVKCDEVRPTCSSCSRRMASCVYVDQQVTSGQARLQLETSDHGNQDMTFNSTALQMLNVNSKASYSIQPIRIGGGSGHTPRSPADLNDVNIFDISESRSRRLLELRLLRNYVLNTAQPLRSIQAPSIRAIWSIEVPKMAFQHENLLFVVLSLSALHLLRSEPNNHEIIAAHQQYLHLALREHRKAVTKLSSQNADAVCFASLLMLIGTFASLQDRVLEPYSPPMEWLRMGKGTETVLKSAMNTSKDAQPLKFLAIINAAPPTLSNNTFPLSKDSQINLPAILSQDIARIRQAIRAKDAWDTETHEAYEKTLSYIASIQLAILHGDPAPGIYRMIMGFSLFLPPKFVYFVEQQRPLALVVLAHFFALGAQLDAPIWWKGNFARREIQAIQRVVPPEWQDQMRWPLEKTGLI